MDKKETISKIKTLKNIKPDPSWASSVRTTLVAYAASFTPAPLIRGGFYFSLASKLTVGLASLGLVFGGLFVSAQTVGINSPLYAVKTFSQKALIVLMPSQYRLDLKIAFAYQMIGDLQKVTRDGKVVAAAQDISQNLNDITSDLKKVSHPEKAVALSKKIQEETSQIKTNLNDFSQNNAQLSDSLKQVNATVDQINAEVVAVMKEAEDKISNCPAHISKQVSDLTNYINSTQIAESSQKDIASQILEANNYLKAGHCVDALVVIDKINKDLFTP